ncbi:MAG: hypothetical protein R3Y13_00720 [bacterium]
MNRDAIQFGNIYMLNIYNQLRKNLKYILEKSMEEKELLLDFFSNPTFKEYLYIAYSDYIKISCYDHLQSNIEKINKISSIEDLYKMIEIDSEFLLNLIIYSITMSELTEVEKSLIYLYPIPDFLEEIKKYDKIESYSFSQPIDLEDYTKYIQQTELSTDEDLLIDMYDNAIDIMIDDLKILSIHNNKEYIKTIKDLLEGAYILRLYMSALEGKDDIEQLSENSTFPFDLSELVLDRNKENLKEVLMFYITYKNKINHKNIEKLIPEDIHKRIRKKINKI